MFNKLYLQDDVAVDIATTDRDIHHRAQPVPPSYGDPPSYDEAMRMRIGRPTDQPNDSEVNCDT